MGSVLTALAGRARTIWVCYSEVMNAKNLGKALFCRIFYDHLLCSCLIQGTLDVPSTKGNHSYTLVNSLAYPNLVDARDLNVVQWHHLLPVALKVFNLRLGLIV